MKLSTTLLPLIVSAAAVNAKVPKGVQTKFCYRDGATATASVSLSYSESYDYDAAAAWIDMGHFKIEDDEALLVEATVETLFLKEIDLEDESADVFLDSRALMRAAIFKGCTSFDDCMTQNITPIDPKPNGRVPIKVGKSSLRSFCFCFCRGGDGLPFFIEPMAPFSWVYPNSTLPPSCVFKCL